MINPMDIDPDTGRPYANYSSPSLDTSFHDHEMGVGRSYPILVTQVLRTVRETIILVEAESLEGAFELYDEGNVDLPGDDAWTVLDCEVSHESGRLAS